MGNIVFFIIVWLILGYFLKSLKASAIILIALFIIVVILIYRSRRDKEKSKNFETEEKRYDGIEMRPIVNTHRASTYSVASSSQKTTNMASSYEDLSFEELDYFEDHYMKKADSLHNQFEEICEKIETTFYDMFDLNRRIRMLEKAITKYNEWKNFCYDKGKAGRKYFDSDYSLYLNSDLYPLNRDFSGDYIFEFENREFRNIDFLTSLYNEYVSKPEESKKHLKLEYAFYCGDTEEYKLFLKIQSLPSDLLKIINNSDGILQKDLYPLFDEQLKREIQKTVKDLISQNKIIAIKSGNSYMLEKKQ